MIKLISCNVKVDNEDHLKPKKSMILELDYERIRDGIVKNGKDYVAKEIGLIILDYMEVETGDDPLNNE